MIVWQPPSWPKPVPPEPRLAALMDAVDAFLCGLTPRDGLQRALRDAWKAKP